MRSRFETDEGVLNAPLNRNQREHDPRFRDPERALSLSLSRGRWVEQGSKGGQVKKKAASAATSWRRAWPQKRSRERNGMERNASGVWITFLTRAKHNPTSHRPTSYRTSSSSSSLPPRTRSNFLSSPLLRCWSKRGRLVTRPSRLDQRLFLPALLLRLVTVTHLISGTWSAQIWISIHRRNQWAMFYVFWQIGRINGESFKESQIFTIINYTYKRSIYFWTLFIYSFAVYISCMTTRTCVYNSLRGHYEARVLLSRKHCKAHYNGETSFLQRVESITNPI